MNREQLIENIKRLLAKHGRYPVAAIYAEAREFLRVYAGEKSAFYESIKQYDPLNAFSEAYADLRINEVLNGFLEYVEAGLHGGISPERRAQLDVVSDFLEMAHTLLDSKGVHPATPAVIIGATLEEFLRTWVEAENLPLANRKPGLETYSQILRDANLITKQDGKDITSWAGVRNHAAHGEWQEVSDKNRVTLMLEGVNLFMRKYSA
jgi:hypothetical protein